MNESDREILDHFRHIRSKTMDMLKAVPDELLACSVEGEQHRLSWQFAHIASGVNWWMHHVMRDGQGLTDDYPTAKDAIMEKLAASRDRLLSFFTADDGEPMGRTYAMPANKQPEAGLTEWIGRNRVLYLTAHELHHLGRAELGLWQMGLTELPDFP